MKLERVFLTYSLGLMAAVLGHTVLGLSWPLALAIGAGGLPTWLLVVLAQRGRHEVVAVRSDLDFGRISLLDDGRWEGAVSLAGLPRPVDVEIEAKADCDGPSLAQRLAYQDACAHLLDLVPSLAEACNREPEEFEASANFLCLRLPAEGDKLTPDWSLFYQLGDEIDAECWEVDVRGGEILGLQQAG